MESTVTYIGQFEDLSFINILFTKEKNKYQRDLIWESMSYRYKILGFRIGMIYFRTEEEKGAMGKNLIVIRYQC